MINKNSLKNKSKKQQEEISKATRHREKINQIQKEWEKANKKSQKKKTPSEIDKHSHHTPASSSGSSTTSKDVDALQEHTTWKMTNTDYMSIKDSLSDPRRPETPQSQPTNAEHSFIDGIDGKASGSNPLEKKPQSKYKRRRPRGKGQQLPFSTRYDILRFYWNKIRSEEDMRRFLIRAREEIHLDGLPYSKMYKEFDVYKFIMTHKEELEDNAFNLILFTLCIRGTSTLNRLPFSAKKYFSHEILRQMQSHSSQWFSKGSPPISKSNNKKSANLCDKVLNSKKILKTLDNAVKKLLVLRLPIGNSLVTFATREAIILAKTYMESAGIKVTIGEKAKSIIEGHPISYLLGEKTCYAEINYLRLEAEISYSNLYSDQSRLTFRDHFDLLKEINSKISFSPKNSDEKSQDQSKITINGEDFDASVFEEVVEDNLNDFLANLRFEEKNYDSKLLSKAI